MCQINTEPMISQAGYLDVLGKSFYNFTNPKNINTKLNYNSFIYNYKSIA